MIAPVLAYYLNMLVLKNDRTSHLLQDNNIIFHSPAPPGVLWLVVVVVMQE